jgi:hypothetical protein
MQDNAKNVAAAFSKILNRVPQDKMDLQQGSRRLLTADPLERLVPTKLLEEGVGLLMDELAPTDNPVVLFMDRAGGGDGARAAAGLMPILGKRWPGVSFIHVSFATQSRGLGVLIRGVLMRSGAMNGVAVHVVAHNRPAEGLDLSGEDSNSLLEKCNLVITFAPGGTAGLIDEERNSDVNPLLKRSHLCVLSYPDPEGLVAGLGEFREIIKKDPVLSAVNFRVQTLESSSFNDIGSAMLGSDLDITGDLGILLDTAEPHTYRVLMEPLRGDSTVLTPLTCPNEAAIREHLKPSSSILRTVPAGSRLVTVARGKETML